jgi:virulence factor Mce-like protein
MIARLERIPPRLIGLTLLAVFLLVTVAAFTGIYRRPFAAPSRTVVAYFDRAAQLYPGDQVRLEGDIDGKVDRVQRSAGGQRTKVTMAVDRSAGPVYADASARLRMKTLLGGSFYVELDRGTAAAGPLGTRAIPRERTHVQVELEDVTDIFRDGAVQGLQTLPGQTAAALGRPDAVAGDIAQVGKVAPDATTALRALRGSTPDRDLRALVSTAARTTRILDTRDGQLHALVSGAAATLATTGRRSPELRQTIAATPGATAQLTGTLARLDHTLRLADGLIARVDPALPDLAPTLRSLRPALDETRGLLVKARPLLRTLPPLLTGLGDTATGGVPLVDALRPALAKVDDTILPYLAKKDPVTGYSTTVMIGGTAAGLGGTSNQMDQNGHFIRFPASVSASSVYLPCRSSLLDGGERSLLACDSLGEALSAYLKYLPKLGSGSGARKGG